MSSESTEQDKIRAGVTLMIRFCRPSHSAFGGYITYIDREEAKRAAASAAYNLYQDYMGNPEKASAIFTADHDRLSHEQISSLKSSFLKAQEDGSNMWQTVISFDNRWLAENNLYDPVAGSLDDTHIKNVTRNAVRKMLKNEDLGNALWSAAIHYNTDNIHVHIAIVDPYLSRKKKEFIFHRPDGSIYKQTEYVGRFKLQTLQTGKSSVVNDILSDKENNRLITELIRNTIVTGKKGRNLAEDPELQELFVRIYEMLPENPSLWKYNMNAMAGIRPQLDQLTDSYIQKYHADDYRKLILAISEQAADYRKAYGDSRPGSAFIETKLKDLHVRMGNAILQEMKEFHYARIRESRQQDCYMKGDSSRDPKNNPKTGQRKSVSRKNLSSSVRQIRSILVHNGYRSDMELNQAVFLLKKSLRETFEEILNEQKFQNLQNEQVQHMMTDNALAHPASQLNSETFSEQTDNM